MNIFEIFRELNYIDDGISKYVVESILNNARKHQVDVEALHEKIIAYMVSKNENDISRYLHYLKISKPIKTMQINCETIENRVKNEIREINALIEELEL